MTCTNYCDSPCRLAIILVTNQTKPEGSVKYQICTCTPASCQVHTCYITLLPFLQLLTLKPLKYLPFKVVFIGKQNKISDNHYFDFGFRLSIVIKRLSLSESWLDGWRGMKCVNSAMVQAKSNSNWGAVDRTDLTLLFEVSSTSYPLVYTPRGLRQSSLESEQVLAIC